MSRDSMLSFLLSVENYLNMGKYFKNGGFFGEPKSKIKENFISSKFNGITQVKADLMNESRHWNRKRG